MGPSSYSPQVQFQPCSLSEMPWPGRHGGGGIQGMETLGLSWRQLAPGSSLTGFPRRPPGPAREPVPSRRASTLATSHLCALGTEGGCRAHPGPGCLTLQSAVSPRGAGHWGGQMHALHILTPEEPRAAPCLSLEAPGWTWCTLHLSSDPCHTVLVSAQPVLST